MWTVRVWRYINYVKMHRRAPILESVQTGNIGVARKCELFERRTKLILIRRNVKKKILNNNFALTMFFFRTVFSPGCVAHEVLIKP